MTNKFDTSIFNGTEVDFNDLILDLSETLILEKKPVNYKPKQIKSELSTKLIQSKGLLKFKG